MKKVIAGMDLHSNNVVIGVMDMDGKRVASRKLPCELKAVVKFLAPFKKRLEQVAVESTYNWYWCSVLRFSREVFPFGFRWNREVFASWSAGFLWSLAVEIFRPWQRKRFRYWFREVLPQGVLELTQALQGPLATSLLVCQRQRSA